MTEVAKHKSQRSQERLLGQYLDATGKVAGAPIECQFAYPFLHTKRTKSAAGEPVTTPHFVVTVKVPKLSTDATKCSNYGALAAHCMEAAGKAWGSWPQGGKWPIADGDIPYAQVLKPGTTPLTPEQIAERNKWRTGHWIIEATNYLDTGPRVAVVQNGIEQEIKSQSVGGVDLYKSGDYGYIFLGAWSFQNKTFGCNFSVSGVCFTRPGERIGAGPKSVQSMFGGVGASVGAGMATAPQPQYTHPQAYVPGANPVAAPGATLPPSAPAGTAPMPPAAPPAPVAAPPAPPSVAPTPPGLPPAPPAGPALQPFPSPGA